MIETAHLKIGQYVKWNCIEGFQTRAVIIALREGDCGVQVRSLDGSQPDSWAYNGELEPDEMTRDDVVRETAKHIRRVGTLVGQAASNLIQRAVKHDESKWSEQEWPAFAEATPQLVGLTYGSDEYKQCLKKIKPSLETHYRRNSHHPEHFDEGVDGMTLLDLVEMLCDWKAAGERHANGSILKSIEINTERFKLSSQLVRILNNSVREMFS